MRRVILIAFYIILILFTQGCHLGSGPQLGQNNYPDIQFEETVYDFGIAGQEEKIIQNYMFTNAGNKPLIIEAVKPSCGVLSTLLTPKKVYPGENGLIKVEFLTSKTVGQQTKNIRVYSNDPDEPEIELEVTGVVKTGIALEPEFLYFGDVKKGQTVTKALKLIQLGEDQLEIVGQQLGAILHEDVTAFAQLDEKPE